MGTQNLSTPLGGARDIAQVTHKSPWINGNRGEFKELLNRASFQFTHNLQGHELFELPRLAKLSRLVLESNKADPGNYVLCKVAESVPNVSKQWENFSPTDRVDEAI